LIWRHLPFRAMALIGNQMKTETRTTPNINRFPLAINLPGIQPVKRLWLVGDRAYSWRIQQISVG
jgi:hypothetical protein